jgi:ribosomal-protein-alanine N-acetyltransferase
MIREIIECNNETAKSLVEIEKLIFGTAWDSGVIKEKIQNKKFKYWIYEVENAINGYLGIQFLEEEIEIIGIGVNPGSRRKKIATELMDELVNYFEKSEYRKIILEVRESNAVAQNLYKKYGFKQISKRKKYYVDEDAEVYLKEKIYA